MLPRVHAFEFEDLRWVPASLRRFVTDYLRRVVELFGLLQPAVPLLTNLLRATGRERIVDLGSGSGGAWRTLAPALRETVPDLEVTLSDLYPRPAEVRSELEAVDGVSRYLPTPVDARAVPNTLPGLRTQFLSLHHLRPPEVVAVLCGCVDAGEPYAAFEIQERSLGQALQFLFAPLFVLALTPTIRPIRGRRLLFTYLIPLIPALVLWDGVVSVLRTYSPDELLDLAAQADPEGRFQWDAGIDRKGPGPLVYLTGIPRPTDPPTT